MDFNDYLLNFIYFLLNFLDKTPFGRNNRFQEIHELPIVKTSCFQPSIRTSSRKLRIRPTNGDIEHFSGEIRVQKPSKNCRICDKN